MNESCGQGYVSSPAPSHTQKALGDGDRSIYTQAEPVSSSVKWVTRQPSQLFSRGDGKALKFRIQSQVGAQEWDSGLGGKWGVVRYPWHTSEPWGQ